MKQEELYLHTLKLWTDAYEQDKLEPTSPCHCADGILFRNYGIDYGWTGFFCTVSAKGIDNFSDNKSLTSGVEIEIKRVSPTHFQRVTNNIQAGWLKRRMELRVPYPLEFLQEVEWEFETHAYGKDKDEKAFNAMMAAIKVLDRYHEVKGGTEKLIEVRKTKSNVRGNTCAV